MTWRVELNQLAVDFWCGVGDLAELTRWADAANEATGEVHPDVWDLYTTQTDEEATQLTLNIAKDCNQFEPDSLSAELFVIKSFKKAINLFLSQQLTIQKFGALVYQLDANFVIGHAANSKYLSPYPNWLGNLWHFFDWCDGTWPDSHVQGVVFEASRVLKIIASIPLLDSD